VSGSEQVCAPLTREGVVKEKIHFKSQQEIIIRANKVTEMQF